MPPPLTAAPAMAKPITSPKNELPSCALVVATFSTTEHKTMVKKKGSAVAGRDCNETPPQPPIPTPPIQDEGFVQENATV